MVTVPWLQCHGIASLCRSSAFHHFSRFETLNLGLFRFLERSEQLFLTRSTKPSFHPRGWSVRDPWKDLITTFTSPNWNSIHLDGVVVIGINTTGDASTAFWFELPAHAISKGRNREKPTTAVADEVGKVSIGRSLLLKHLVEVEPTPLVGSA